MIDKPFKIQPVAAFYRLLGICIGHIFVISAILSVIVFLIIKFGILQILDAEGIKELSDLLSAQASSPDMVAQSNMIKKFISDHPSLVPFMMGSMVLILLTIAYSINSTQLFIKNKMGVADEGWLKTLVPQSSFFKIFLYLILTTGTLMFASVFIAIGIAGSPIIGVVASLFIGIMVIRNCLFIPGIVIGGMDFPEAFKYSLQTISGGRAFKILIFGLLIFFMLSFILSALFYFPTVWFRSGSAQIYFNFLILYLQMGFISVGLTSLFLRYGIFEEEKIAE